MHIKESYSFKSITVCYIVINAEEKNKSNMGEVDLQV